MIEYEIKNCENSFKSNLNEVIDLVKKLSELNSTFHIIYLKEDKINILLTSVKALTNPIKYYSIYINIDSKDLNLYKYIKDLFKEIQFKGEIIKDKLPLLIDILNELEDKIFNFFNKQKSARK